MSESDCSDSHEEEGPNVQLQFVRILQKFPVLLNKSQLPSVKKEKSESLRQFCDIYRNTVGKNISEDQVKKKINNMKTEVKKKSDKNETGNKKLKLKVWEELFLTLITGNGNPVISRVPGGCSAGLDNSGIEAEPVSKCYSDGSTNNESFSIANVYASIPPAVCTPSAITQERGKNNNGTMGLQKMMLKQRKRSKLPETAETENLTTSELQRLVLLEQLKLIRMQQQQICTVEPLELL